MVNVDNHRNTLKSDFLLYVLSDVLCKKHTSTRRSKNSDDKIVGGSEVSIKNVPYQAHLLIETPKGYYGCGGSIISDTYILTAAHCLPE